MKCSKIAVDYYLHLVIPCGLNFDHAILAMCVISLSSFGVSKRTTTDRVNGNEKNEHDNVEN